MPAPLLIVMLPEVEKIAPLAVITRRELMLTAGVRPTSVCPVTAATEMTPVPVVLSI